jgi:NADPH2:quinone reductase
MRPEVMKAVYIEQHGGIEVLQYGDRPVPKPAAGEVLVKVAASGVNFTDTYHRIGLYKIPLPAVIGSEGAGTVESVGEGVTGFKPGDRVAYAMARGSYAEYQAVPARLLVHVPPDVELRDAAAVLLQGMTAYYLTHSTFPLKPGHTALVHAGAGGTGRLLIQIAVMLGARVIATAGTPAKAELARAAGASDVILYNQGDWSVEVKALTGGVGVDVIYDSVGKATFMYGLDCLKTCGMMVTFGQSSGAVEAFDILLLMAKGSLYVTRPTLGNHSSEAEISRSSADLFRWMAEGKLKLRVEHTYPLAEAARAHQDLEGRRTTGKLLLVV